MARLYIGKLRSMHSLTILILIAWLIAFTLHERYLTRSTIRKCSWPPLKESKVVNPNRVVSPKLDLRNEITNKDEGSTTSDDERNKQSNEDGEVAFSNMKILFIADPQLIDNHTYPGRNQLLLKLSQHTVDVYLKKNYYYLINELQPDYIFWLGDYLDNGRSSTDEYFYTQLSRFNKIFYNRFKKTYKRNVNFFVNLAGNHDIGFGDEVKLDSRERFEKEFGAINHYRVLDGLGFITFDTLSFSSTHSNINRESRDFLDNYFNGGAVKDVPRILLSHVPLYRDPNINCGPIRENPKFNVHGGGYQYKNTIDEALTEEILTKIQPDLIFAGDDHDYCDIIHSNGASREITVKSISMAMGIKIPAVQLLSVSISQKGHESTLTYGTDVCHLQTPYENIFSYVILAIVSGLLVLFSNLKQAGTARFQYSAVLPLANSNSTKLRNFLREQEEGENEEEDEEEEEDMSSTSFENNLTSHNRKTGSFSLPSTASKLLHIPNYTFTSSVNNSSFLTKVGGGWISNKLSEFTKFFRKWNLGNFFKQSIILAILVISVYYFLFCLTL
ncbi:protein that affects bud emergence, intrachromosomal recombination, and nuclear division [Scheffersomyces amazonensis]|uniref:protein that affects bud emergence, intrachromosomal recombination, and nuclear division n=1 Tax=Scheffersomyces amazonensis TaxID=1078765 RepID=UPI00315D400E